MEINTFIRKARLTGRSDDQIRAFLVDRGYPAQDVDSALGIQPAPVRYHENPAPQPQQPQAQQPPPQYVPTHQVPVHAPNHQAANHAAPAKAKKRKAKLPRKAKIPIMISAVLLVFVGAGLTFLAPKSGQAKSNSEALQMFITAMQKQDKETADALMSPGSKEFFKASSGTDSIYDSCLRAGSVCAPLFNVSFIDKAKKTEKEYKSGLGSGQGIETTYLLAQKLVEGPNCKNESISTLTISAVSLDGKWMIDKITPQYDTAGLLCQPRT